MASKVPDATGYALIYGATFVVYALPVFYYFFSRSWKNRAREDFKEMFGGLFKLERSLSTERNIAKLMMMAEFMQLTALSFVGSIPWVSAWGKSTQRHNGFQPA